jgi:phosphoribosylglycinamide formyltransferase-1
MYGMHVHKAVIAAREKESGITVHYVNEEYDKGEVILQASLKVEETDTPETLARRIQQLEFEYLPKAVERFL